MSEARDPRVYELGYLVLPTVGDAKIGDVVATLHKTITHHGGEKISEGTAELIDIAYPMTKVIENKRATFHTGYFGWVKFEVVPEKLDSIKAMLDSNGDLLRYLLIGTIREDTMTKKRVASRRPRSAEEGTDVSEKTEAAASEETKPVDEEQLDEKLDTIVG